MWVITLRQLALKADNLITVKFNILVHKICYSVFYFLVFLIIFLHLFTVNQNIIDHTYSSMHNITVLFIKTFFNFLNGNSYWHCWHVHKSKQTLKIYQLMLTITDQPEKWIYDRLEMFVLKYLCVTFLADDLEKPTCCLLCICLQWIWLVFDITGFKHKLNYLGWI